MSDQPDPISPASPAMEGTPYGVPSPETEAQLAVEAARTEHGVLRDQYSLLPHYAPLAQRRHQWLLVERSLVRLRAAEERRARLKREEGQREREERGR